MRLLSGAFLNLNLVSSSAVIHAVYCEFESIFIFHQRMSVGYGDFNWQANSRKCNFNFYGFIQAI